jgi:hypothetical protein
VRDVGDLELAVFIRGTDRHVAGGGGLFDRRARQPDRDSQNLNLNLKSET